VESSQCDSTSNTRIPEDVQEAYDYIFEFHNLDDLSVTDFEINLDSELLLYKTFNPLSLMLSIA
jgi:hypothetical protein